VVDAAGNERPIGIAIEEIDDDFLTDARIEDHAPVFAGPRLGHAHPARAVLILLAQAVPEELNLDPSVFIGVNLLAFRPDDDGRLRSLHEGLMRTPRRAKGDRGWNARKLVAVFRTAVTVEMAVVRCRVLDSGDDIRFACLRIDLMRGEREF